MALTFEREVLLKINIQTAQWVRVTCGTKSRDGQRSHVDKVTLASSDFATSREQMYALQWNMAYGARPEENPHSCSLPKYYF